MADIVLRFREESNNLINSLKEQRELIIANANAEKELGDQSDKTTRKEETNAQKRKRLLKEEQQDLKELERSRDKAYDPKEIDEYNKRIAETRKRINNLSGQYPDLEKKTNNLGKAFTRLSGFIAGAFAVDRLISFGREAIDLAGKTEGVERAFQKLDNPTLLNDLRKATRGTVSDLELMQQAVRANNFRIPLENLATYFEFATKRAAETGESVDYLVNSIIDGIGRKSTLVLDNLGISATELQEEVKRVGDFGQAAGNIIEKQMEAAGEVLETTGQRTARLNAELKNQTAEIGKQLTPVWNVMLETTADFIKVGSKAGEVIRDNSNLFGMLADEVWRYYDNTQRTIDGLNHLTAEELEAEEAIRQQNLTMREATERAKEAATEFAKLATGPFKNTTEEAEAMTKAMEAFRQTLGVTGSSAVEHTTTISSLNKEIAELKELQGNVSSEEQYLSYQNRIEAKQHQIDVITGEYNKKLAEQVEQLKALRKEADEILDSVVGNVSNEKLLKDLFGDKEKISLDDLVQIEDEMEDTSIVEGFDEATKKAKEAGFKNFKEYSDYVKKQQEELNGFIFDSTMQLFGQLLDQQIEASRRRSEARIEIINEERDQEIDALEKQRQRELSSENLTKEQRLAIDQRFTNKRKSLEEQYDEKVKEVQAQQAEREKRIAIFQAIINTASSVVAALGAQPWTPANFAFAAAVAAFGAAQIGLIASEPIPQFYEGTEYLKRGKNKPGRDTIPLWANEGEAIIKADENAKMPGLAKAWNDGYAKKFIHENFVVPEIQKIAREMEIQKEQNRAQSLAENIAESIVFNSSNKDVVRALSKNASLTKRSNELLENLNKSKRNWKFLN